MEALISALVAVIQTANPYVLLGILGIISLGYLFKWISKALGELNDLLE